MIRYVINSPTSSGTNLYLTNDFDWTTDIDEARTFISVDAANSFCQEYKLVSNLDFRVDVYNSKHNLQEIIINSLELL